MTQTPGKQEHNLSRNIFHQSPNPHLRRQKTPTPPTTSSKPTNQYFKNRLSLISNRYSSVRLIEVVLQTIITGGASFSQMGEAFGGYYSQAVERKDI